jgi:hypothetical protein
MKEGYASLRSKGNFKKTLQGGLLIMLMEEVTQLKK